MANHSHRYRVHDNVVLVLSVFIIFILLFEHRLVIPGVLQAFGRLHPLVLHLPIALLLVALALEFFTGGKSTDTGKNAYQQLTGVLLFAGVATSGIAVIMGIFLAREGDHGGGELLWHKWTGVAVYFVAVAIYSFRTAKWYSPSVAKTGAIATTVCLVIAGHFGGSLTHGDNFVLAPVLPESEYVDKYHFPAADDETVQSLNSNYRVIRPVALNSSALAVNIYNRAAYASNVLDELKALARQIVSLDLSKMPVQDKDLEYLARFENLETLNLNFTDIHGDGLASLAGLKSLREISLTGTPVTFEALKTTLGLLDSLAIVAVWDTGLSDDEMQLLAETLPDVSFAGKDDYKTSLIKLNPPRLKNKIRVFNETLPVELFHAVKNTDIRFALDGKDPDSVSANLFEGKLVVDKTAAIRARAFKKGWISSDVATLQVYRRAHQPDTAILSSKMNRVHTAKGADTFFDFELGGFNANSPAWANNWGGFRNNDMDLLVKYDEPRAISSVSLNTLIETENSIFPPSVVEVWGGNTERDMMLLATKRIVLPPVYRKPYIELIEVEFPHREVSHVRILAKPVMALPSWHKNKKKPALMLIDEILIN